jgi:LuxR family maltose regulon positive regulatory protein
LRQRRKIAGGCEQALETAARTGQPPSPAAGPAYVGLAEVAYQRNELDSALDNAERGIAPCRSFVVLGKLGAANRTEAVTRARELGLIP